MAALEVHSARCEDCLEGLLNRLLGEEAHDVIGHVTMVCERAQSASLPAALASSALATSSSSRFDKHPTLGECSVESGAGCLAPFLNLRVAVDQHVDRSAHVV